MIPITFVAFTAVLFVVVNAQAPIPVSCPRQVPTAAAVEAHNECVERVDLENGIDMKAAQECVADCPNPGTEWNKMVEKGECLIVKGGEFTAKCGRIIDVELQKPVQFYMGSYTMLRGQYFVRRLLNQAKKCNKQNCVKKALGDFTKRVAANKQCSRPQSERVQRSAECIADMKIVENAMRKDTCNAKHEVAAAFEQCGVKISDVKEMNE